MNATPTVTESLSRLKPSRPCYRVPCPPCSNSDGIAFAIETVIVQGGEFVPLGSNSDGIAFAIET